MRAQQNWALALLIASLFTRSAIADSIDVNGAHILAQWRKGDTIWYLPRTVQREQKQDSYNPCETELSTRPTWTMEKNQGWMSPPCILVPPKADAWVNDFNGQYQSLKALKKSQVEKLPEERLSSAQISEKFSRLQKRFQKQCPRSLQVVMYSKTDGTAEVACIGGTGLTCNKGYTNSGGACTRNVVSPCDEGTFEQEGRCYSCQYGGVLDSDMKHTTTFCDGIGMGGACGTQYYCKVELNDIQVHK
jgi:hypothetical protein